VANIERWEANLLVEFATVVVFGLATFEANMAAPTADADKAKRSRDMSVISLSNNNYSRSASRYGNCLVGTYPIEAKR
jgi:hypothetical protein